MQAEVEAVTERLQAKVGACPEGSDQFELWDTEIEVYHHDIMVAKNAMPFLKDLPLAARDLDWATSEVVSSGDALNSSSSVYEDERTRKSDRVTLIDNGSLARFEDFVQGVEATFIKTYQDNVNRHVNITSRAKYELLRYGEGGLFVEHVDSVKNDPTLAHRRISAVAFCNSGGGEDFAGGELVFPRHGLKITPEAGMLVLFPSGFTHPHGVEPVTRGVRFSVVSWYY